MSTVASRPLVGDAVTDTVAPAGTKRRLVHDVLERDELEGR